MYVVLEVKKILTYSKKMDSIRYACLYLVLCFVVMRTRAFRPGALTS